MAAAARAMIGLHARTEADSELLLGKHFVAAIGARVVFSQRYEKDMWARDECNGRLGTVVELLEPVKHEGAVQHTAVKVRWDRADSKKWEPRGASEALSTCYMGTYRCGSKGCYHLALAPGQPLPPLPGASSGQLKRAADLMMEFLKKKEEEEDKEKKEKEKSKVFDPSAWGADVDADALLAEPAGLAFRRQQIEKEIEELTNRLAGQMATLADACKECVNEAEIALNLREGWEKDLIDKKDEEKKKDPDEDLTPEEKKIKEEQDALSEDMERLWGFVEKAQKTYQKKVEADEEARKAADDLEEQVLGRYLVQCSADVPELIRLLERIAQAGSGDSSRKRQTVPYWATAKRTVGGDADKIGDAADSEDKMKEGMGEVRGKVAELAKVLRGLTFPVKNGRRPELIDVLLDEEKKEDLLARLDDVMEQPEAAGCKEEITAVKDRLKQGVEALGKLQEHDELMQQPQLKPQVALMKELADAITKRATLRKEVMVAMAPPVEGADTKDDKKKDDKKKDDKKKDDKKKDDKKEEEKPAKGPEWDPLDTLSKMLLRSHIITKERQALAANKNPKTREQEIQTEGKLLRITRQIAPKLDDPVIPWMPLPKEYYKGRVAMYDMDPGPLPDVESADLLKARRALADAQRILLLLDTERVQDEVKAEEGDKGVPNENRVSDLDKMLERMEEKKLLAASKASTEAHIRSVGAIRGELFGDVGGAGEAYGLARLAMEEALEAQAIAAQAKRAGQVFEARWHQRRCCEQAARLLSEGQGLYLEANKKLDSQQPLDAFLLLKDAQHKLKRAASLPGDPSGGQ